MKWLVTGSTGQLGQALTRALTTTRHGDQVLAQSHADLDITDQDRVMDVLSEWRPDVVINCAAWTNVDLAERHEADVFKINTQAAANLAQTLMDLRLGSLIQISTDYVFGGDTPGPHDEHDEVEPIGVYARSKALAEESVRSALPDRHLIIRTAWLYSEFGMNFAKTVMHDILSSRPLRVVDDQRGQPTYAHDASGRIIELGVLLQGDLIPSGTYHAVNAGSATWWDFAAAIAELMKSEPRLIARVSSADLDLPAQRPSDSRLGDSQGEHYRLPPMRPWRVALAQAYPVLRASL